MAEFGQPEGWQPNDYQRSLLAALGDRDPADVQAQTPGHIRALIAEAGEHLRVRPAPHEWSVFQCVAHIVDAELVISGRLRFILAQDKPPMPNYDQDLWIDKIHVTDDESPDELLAWFEPLRARNLRLWREASAEDRMRVGMHSERGPESFELTYRLYAGHDLVHLGQARRTLQQVANH